MTNQITTTGISHDMERESDWSVSGGSHVTAALGNTWAHCVNTRLLLGHLPHPHRIVSLHTHTHTHTHALSLSLSLAQLTIEKSPVSDCQTFVVAIEERGVVLDPTVNANGQFKYFTNDVIMMSFAHSGPSRGGAWIELCSSSSFRCGRIYELT